MAVRASTRTVGWVLLPCDHSLHHGVARERHRALPLSLSVNSISAREAGSYRPISQGSRRSEHGSHTGPAPDRTGRGLEFTDARS
jgi:hypothetical protein